MPLLKQPLLLARLLRAVKILAHQNYRYFFSGQTVAVAGSLIQIVAINWLVYRTTDSVFFLGLINFSRHFPTFLFGLFTGPLLDRWPRKKILTLTQSTVSLLAWTLFFLFYFEVLRFWMLLIICLLLGLLNAVETPSRQAFVADITRHRENLALAISFDSVSFNLARLIGPSLGGLLIAVTDEGFCFLLNALCYLVGIVTLFFVKPQGLRQPKIDGPLRQQIREGLIYAFQSPPIVKTLALIGSTSILGISFLVLMLPVYAKDVLQLGPQALGFLHSAWGGGAILGGLYLASRRTVGLEQRVWRASVLFGLMLLLFSQAKNFWLVLFAVGMAGLFRMLQLTAGNTYLQTIVASDKRGRVMTFFAMTFVGVAPFGTLMAGLLAHFLGTEGTLLTGGLCCLFLPLLLRQKQPISIGRAGEI